MSRPWPVWALLVSGVLYVALAAAVTYRALTMLDAGLMAPEHEVVLRSPVTHALNLLSVLMFLIGVVLLFQLRRAAVIVFWTNGLIAFADVGYFLFVHNGIDLDPVWLLLCIAIPYSMYLRSRDYLR